MKRDGARTSVWQQGIPDYQSNKEKLPTDMVDVVIVGGGITGVSLGLELQKAGKSCVIMEAKQLGFGTTGGTTAHLNTMLDTSYSTIENNFGKEAARTVADATKDAISLVRKNIAEYQIDCSFLSLPGYLYAQNEEQAKELEKISQASQEAGIELIYTNELPVPVPFEKAIVFKGQAQFHPINYVYALAKVFENRGGIVLQNCRVLEHHEENDHLSVSTALGEIQCQQLVYATHIPSGFNLMHVKCAPYRSYVIGFQLNNEAYPNAMAYDMHDPYNYHRTQVIEGKKYVILGGKDHKTGHEENTERFFDELEAYARKHYDVASVDFKWSSQYFEPTDGLAYIGHLPGAPENVWVATGYSGNGMTFSQIAALELTSLILTGQSKYNELFSPGRIKMGGLGNFMKENTDVAVQYAKKLLAASKLEELVGLAKGEGKVVKYEDETVALHKDESGHLHGVNPTCTHAACSVAWNGAEKSWDCPCHGARYSCDGEVLTGPAQKDLKTYDFTEKEADAPITNSGIIN